MALNFKTEPLLGRKYSATICGSINQLLGTNFKGYMTQLIQRMEIRTALILNLKKLTKFFYLEIRKDLFG